MDCSREALNLSPPALSAVEVGDPDQRMISCFLRSCFDKLSMNGGLHHLLAGSVVPPPGVPGGSSRLKKSPIAARICVMLACLP